MLVFDTFVFVHIFFENIPFKRMYPTPFFFIYLNLRTKYFLNISFTQLYYNLEYLKVKIGLKNPCQNVALCIFYYE